MVCKSEQRRMRKKVQQALQPTHGSLMDTQQTSDIIDNYMLRNADNYDVETLIPVSSFLASLLPSVALVFALFILFLLLPCFPASLLASLITSFNT